MLLAGDEHGHSQHGNNNAYCQDNELTWFDWSQADEGLVRRILVGRARRQCPLAERRGRADAA
ncbi:Glycogen debranching enzyme [Cronobacter muytjensii 530]